MTRYADLHLHTSVGVIARYAAAFPSASSSFTIGATFVP